MTVQLFMLMVGAFSIGVGIGGLMFGWLERRAFARLQDHTRSTPK